jgi:LuxR family maltose regulon positive regulatory protein
VLADAALRLGDTDLARDLLDDADRLAVREEDLGRLTEDLVRLRARLGTAAVPLGAAVTPLTQAEVRVLRYLPTHLSFGEIAAELFVSRNTVKTQAIAIYRKLGVSSRSAAVQTARDMGIIEP